MEKREAAKLVMQEERHRTLYGFPILPPLFVTHRLSQTGKCRECHTYEVIRHGYCLDCLMPDLIRLRLN